MDTNQTYLPVVSVAIAFLALIISLYNSTISRRALTLAKQQFQNKLSSFQIYLIDNFCTSIKDERILLFHVTLSNRSETKNSFLATLYLEYIKDNGNVVKIKLLHDPGISSRISNRSFTLFDRNIFLNDKESVSKWLIFRYSEELTKNNRIDKYTISLTDVNGIEQHVSSSIMKEFPNEI